MSRLSLLSTAFRDVPLTCGPLTLRPITAGSVLLLMETKNALFTEGPGGDSEAAAFQGLFEFIYIHSAPEEEVVMDCDHPETLRAKARKLGIGISFEDLASFQAQFENIRRTMNASLVDIVPEKGDTMGKPAAAMPPPTGSPHSSTPSAQPEIQIGSTGFSGASHSPEPSNTSTPRTSLEEPDAAGRSRIWDPAPETQPPTADFLQPLP